MKKTLDSSVVRIALGVAILALGIGSARVVVSSADVDGGSVAPVFVSTTAAELPANVGSMAGLVAGSDLVDPVHAVVASSPRDAAHLEAAELLAAQRAAQLATPDDTTTTEASTTTLPDSTTTTADSSPDPPAATTTTVPLPETTTTTTPPVTTTTVAEETTTTTAAGGAYSGVLTEAEALELFSMYFAGADLDTAMRVALCESSYNTDAYNPAGYGGLFQHSIADWPDRAVQAGWAGASIYDGEANTAVTAWLVAAVGGWSPWPNC